MHRFIQDNENQIDEFIVRSHERLRSAGMAYLKQAIEMVKTKILGLPAGEPSTTAAAHDARPTPTSAQSYTQSLLARFSVPVPRWSAAAASHTAGYGNGGASSHLGAGSGGVGGGGGADFYNLLAGAVSSMVSASSTGPSSPRSGTLIPPEVRGANEKMSFIAAQRSHLTTLLGALDREAQHLQREEKDRGDQGHNNGHEDVWSSDNESHTPYSPPPRPASVLSGVSGASGLSKSRSETDFEKIDANDTAAEDNGVRRRLPGRTATGGSAGWMPWGWGASGPADADQREG